MLLMAEIGIGVHVIVSSITFYAAAILPFPGKRLLVAAAISFARMERKKVSTGI
jgi:ABC-type glycerol-3-phosphate transport system permease component